MGITIMKLTHKFSCAFTLLFLLSGSFFNTWGNKNINCDEMFNSSGVIRPGDAVIIQTIKDMCIKTKEKFDEGQQELNRERRNIVRTLRNHSEGSDVLLHEHKLDKKQQEFDRERVDTWIVFFIKKGNIIPLTEEEEEYVKILGRAGEKIKRGNNNPE